MKNILVAIVSFVSFLSVAKAEISKSEMPDPILYQSADNLNAIYKGDIHIRKDSRLDRAGLWDVNQKTIWINPGKFREFDTNLGGVLAHEMNHAMIDGLSILRDSKPIKREFPYRSIAEQHAQKAELDFRNSYQNRIKTESKIAQGIGKNYNFVKRDEHSQLQSLNSIKSGDFKSSFSTVSQNYSTSKNLNTVKMPSSSIQLNNNLNKYNTGFKMNTYGTGLRDMLRLPSIPHTTKNFSTNQIPKIPRNFISH